MASNKVLLITGANTGLGFETVKAICQSSKAYTILLGGRSLEKAEAAVRTAQEEFPKSPSTLKAVQIDIEDDASISRLATHVEQEYGHLDILINNAGGQFDPQLAAGKMSMREMWNKSWNVNTTSTYILTHTLMPLLLNAADPRLLFITSGTSTLTESENPALAINKIPVTEGWPKDSLGIPAYRSSKTGMNMMMREWARVLKKDGIKVWCISPGFLATGLGGNPAANKQMGAGDPSEGANFIRSVVDGARDEDVGKVIRRTDVQPW